MVGADYVVGGIPAIVDTIVSSDQSEIEFHVTVSPGKTLDKGVPSFKGAKIHYLELRYGFIRLVKTAIALRKIIQKNEIDVIHLHAARAGLLGILAGVGTKVKIVYTGHGWRSRQLLPSLKRKIVEISERLIGFSANSVTFLTWDEKRYGNTHRLFRSERGIVVSTRIDGKFFSQVDEEEVENARKFLRAKPERTIVGMIGRLNEQKDPLLFVEIAAKFVKIFPHVDFVWIGEGQLRSDVNARIQTLNLTDRVYFPGALPRAQIPGALNVIDCLLLTSRYEGLPVTLLEAYASGTLVMSRDFEGVRDYLIDGVNGFIFEEDYESKIHDIIHLIVHKDPKIFEVADNGKQTFVTNYDNVNKMVKEYVDLYLI